MCLSNGFLRSFIVSGEERAIRRTIELRSRHQSDYRNQNPVQRLAGMDRWDLFGIAGREKFAHDFDNLAKAGPLLTQSPLTTFDSRSLRPALFLDRDGTVNVEVHYLSQPEQLELLPTVAKTISAVNALGIAVVIVTNQAGIARGYFPEHRLLAIHERLQRMLAEQNARIDGIYFCPHHPTAGQGRYKAVCDCRKPMPGMLRQAASELGLDLTRSLMVGDRESDLEAGAGAGCQTALVTTGYGLETSATLDRNSWRGIGVYPTVGEAVDAWLKLSANPLARR